MTTSATPRSLTRARTHAPLLWTLVRSPGRVWRYMWSRRTPKLPKLVMLLAVAYAILPVDLIPDVAPLIGWLDDIGVVGVALGYVLSKVSEAEAPPAAPEGPIIDVEPQATADLTSS